MSSYIFSPENVFGDMFGQPSLQQLQAKQRELAGRGVEMLIGKKPLCVAVVTPLMRRCHSFSDISDVCYLDSNNSATILYGITKFGGLPLGAVFHQGSYTAAFNLLKTLLGPTSFNKQGFPAAIITEDNNGIRNALRSVFPQTQLFLCFLEDLLKFWHDTPNGFYNVCPYDKLLLTRLFKKLLFATSEADFNSKVSQLMNDPVAKKHSKTFITTVQVMLINSKNKWCLPFRKVLSAKRFNVEDYMRVFKDCNLLRYESYSMIPLLHFTCVILENFHVRRLLAYAGIRADQPKLVYTNLVRKAHELDTIEQNSETHYEVASASGEYDSYDVYTDIMQCSCPQGVKIDVKICKHYCAVHMEYDLAAPRAESLTEQEMKNLEVLALGTEDIEFGESLEDFSSDEDQDSSGENSTSDEQNVGQDSESTKEEALTELKQHLDRLLQLAQGLSGTDILKLCSTLSRVQTQSQFDLFFNSSTAVEASTSGSQKRSFDLSRDTAHSDPSSSKRFK
jgi:hypothetical protein